MMEDEIILKSKRNRLSDRISVSVEPALKDLYDECMRDADVAEDLRRYLRHRLPDIKEKIAKRSA